MTEMTNTERATVERFEMGEPAPESWARCPNVLHIDWDADPTPVREDVARCVLAAGHEKRHEGRDNGGSWLRW